VWLTLGVGAIGGGDLFAVYAYISPIMTDRAGLASGLVPIALAVWRLGMVARSVRHRRPHRRLATTARDVRLLVAMAAFFALFTVCWAPRRWRSGAHRSHRHGRELRHRRRPDQDDVGAGW
jgi:predicted MFS family arabinose efflux permease